MTPTITQTDKFQVLHCVTINAENPIGGMRTTKSVVSEHETMSEAQDACPPCAGDFDFFTIGCPQWYREHLAKLKEEDRAIRRNEENDPSHPNYVPF